jgi:acetyl esterase/lipase
LTWTRRAWLGGASGLGLASCSPLQIFDAVAPRDAGSKLAAPDLPYGDHPRQRLDVYVPTGGSVAASPVLVFFYGGSWKTGSRTEYEFVGAALAAQGFVTVLPDYRLHPEVRFPTFLDDGAGAVRWARDNAARYGGDPRRIVLAGHSAGAYNAAMLALDARYLAREGLGRGTVRAFAGLSGPYDFVPLDPGTAQEVFGQAPDLAATQPVTFAGRGSPPAFLATGDADDTVRPRNTTSLAARLRRAGVAVEERVYPGLDHADTLLALSVPFRGKAPVLAEMTAFLRAQAGGGERAAR